MRPSLLNEATGRREGQPGYVGLGGPIEVGGQRTQDVPGVSVAGTVLYNAALQSGLDIVEATPHESFLPPYPAGREVVVSYPGPDLVWRNNTDHGVLIQASASDTAMKVSLWGTKTFTVKLTQSDRTQFTTAPADVRPEGCVPVPGTSGFTIVTVRERVRLDGTAEQPETIKTVYKPRPEVSLPGRRDRLAHRDHQDAVVAVLRVAASVAVAGAHPQRPVEGPSRSSAAGRTRPRTATPDAPPPRPG